MTDSFSMSDRPMHPAPAYPPRRPTGCVAIGVLGLIVGGFGLCMMSAMLAAAGGGGGSGGAPLHEERIEGEGDAKIAMIELEGIIANRVGGGIFGIPQNLPERLKKQFDKAAKDDDVKAVVLYIDSPGGTVTASDQIYHIVKEFRAKSNKPVIVHMGGVCASGGYYIAVAANEIYCEPTTITGSIGVILSTLNFHGLLEKHGVKDVTITSGKNKALLNSTGEPNEEHRKIIQEMVDETHARFVMLVAEGRPFDEDKAKEIADGRIYTSKQAKELELVDGVNYREKTFEHARRLAGVEKAMVVRYKMQPTLFDALSGNVNTLVRGPQPTVDPRTLDELRTPRLMALWTGY